MGEIGYAVDTGIKPVNETFDAGQVIRRRTGATEQRLMRIRNGRPLIGELSLDRNGFVLVEHGTAVTDFFDASQLQTLYYLEIQRLVQAVSGASRVVVFDHTLRIGDPAEQEARKVREPALGTQRLHRMVRATKGSRDLAARGGAIAAASLRDHSGLAGDR